MNSPLHRRLNKRRRSIYRSTAAFAGAALLAATAIVGLGGTAQAATGPTVSGWVTTPDRSQLLNPQPGQVFDSNGIRPGQMITVNPGETYQTMDGFGASLTDSTAALFYGLPAGQRDEVMTSIFHPVNGIGMSFLRQPIGGSDFIDEPHYTYDDLPNGQTDLAMAHFSIAHDESQILPLLRRALQLNPNIKIMGSPWGQPAWMKANNSIIGGRLKDDPAIFHAYALYLVKFVQAYQAAGVPIHFLTVQNEPQNRTPDAYAGTDMPVAHQVAIINELGPMLRDAGLGSVKIVSYDHNWAEHADDITDANNLGVPPEPNYPYDVLRSSAAQWIAGTGYHCYAGDAGAQTALHDTFPNKDIWFTECSGWHGAGDSFAQYFADTLKWHAKNIGIGTTRNWAKAVVNWNLALNSQGRPANGGCANNPAGMCTGAVAVDGTTVTRNAEYYTLGHFSKFVAQGAVRIGSNNAGDLNNVAFRNPDGSTVLVVNNIGGGNQTFGVSWNGMVVSYTLPGGALATYTWPGGDVDNIPPTAPTNLVASGTTSTSTNLSWNPSTDNVGVTGYLVYRNNVQVGTPTGTSYTDTGLTASTAYSYTVRARDAAGNLSPLSSALSVTTQPQSTDTTAPTAPTNVAASGTTASSTNLTWNPSTDNVGVTGYTVYRNNVQVGTTTTTNFTDTGLTAATAYSYTVRARDAAGNQSPLSSALSVTTQTNNNPGLDPTKWYQVINQNSSKCLDDADWNTGNGARLQQWACNSPAANNQSWQFRPTSDGYVQVVNRHATSLVWDVDGGPGATGDGTQVHLWSYGGGTNQQWQAVALGGGDYKFVARNSGKCLDVRDVSTANGASLQQWTCTGGPAQTFHVTQQLP